MHRIVLNLGQGSWQQGFPAVTALLWQIEDSTPMQFTGSLPPAPHLEQQYQRWQRMYEAVYAGLGWRRSHPSSNHPLRNETSELSAFEIDDEDVTHISQSEFEQLCRTLQQGLNQWLSSESFLNIDRKLRTRLSATDEIRLMLMAEFAPVLRLPWSLWHWLEDYPSAELMISPPEYARSLKTIAAPKSKVRILAVLGNAEGIDVSHDRQLLEQLPQTELTLLVEPNRTELDRQLWQSGWDILFFAGHSSSQGAGQIQVNRSETLTIEQLKYSLKTAITQGLKLAIFNSCDGLGLAQDLADLHLPQVIVMREPVPDRVAQDFLKSFLSALSGGQSIYAAVRQSRERLQALETEFPCATWLPVLCQNPAEEPFTWVQTKRHRWPRFTRRAVATVALASLAVTGLLSGVRALGELQSLELLAFDRLMQLRPAELPDSRLLLVEITDADIQAQGQSMRQGSLSDQTLNQLLSTLEQAQPAVIGLDLYRDFPATDPDLASRLRQSDRLIAICKRPDPQSESPDILPPPDVPVDRIGFSDFVQDADGAVRRALLFSSPNTTSRCTPAYALSTQLALRYLARQNINAEFTPSKDLRLGNAVFRRLQRHSSGYQGIDARGSQIMLNYRAAPTPRDIVQRVSVTQILSRQFNPDAVKNRIILIGSTSPNSGDIWVTPYGREFSRRLPGVVIHAQMVSQMVSAVLDRRPLIGVWPFWQEALWMGGWALLGGMLAGLLNVWLRPLQFRLAALMLSSIALVSICYIALLQGGWLPLVPAVLALWLTHVIVQQMRSRSAKFPP